MKQAFCKFTVESLSASYIPFPRFLVEDCFAGLTNDAKLIQPKEDSTKPSE